MENHSFVKYALEKFEINSYFCVALARTDTLPQNDIKAFNYKMKLYLDTFCAGQEIFWGQCDRNCFFVCLPDYRPKNGEEKCHELSRALLKNGITITVGMASFPFSDYSRADTFNNAKKALAHAGFFDPGAIVPFDSVSLNISGDNYYDADDLASAVNEFKKAIELDNTNANAMNSLGECYGRLKDFEKADEMFNKAINLNSRDYIARYNLGLLKLLQGKREEALGLFLQAYNSQGNMFELTFQIGKLYLERKEYAKAREFLSKAVEQAPQSAYVLRHLADALYGDGKLDEAIKAYKKVLGQNPMDPHCLAALADIFHQKGENPEIPLMFYKESIKLAPEQGSLRYKLGKFYMSQDMTDEAIREFNKARVLGYTKD